MLFFDRVKVGDLIEFDTQHPGISAETPMKVINKFVDSWGERIETAPTPHRINGAWFSRDHWPLLVKVGDEANRFNNYMSRVFPKGTRIVLTDYTPNKCYTVISINGNKLLTSPPAPGGYFLTGTLAYASNVKILSPKFKNNKYIKVNTYPTINTAAVRYSRRGNSSVVYCDNTPEAINNAYLELMEKVALNRQANKAAFKRDERGRRVKVPKVYEKPGDIVRLWERKIQRQLDAVSDSKRPKNSITHIGVEIEFLSTSTRKEIAKSLIKAKLDGYTQLKEDGSVKDNDTTYERCYYCQNDEQCVNECYEDCTCCCTCEDPNESVMGHEIAVVARHTRIDEIVSKVCGVLKEHNAYINRSCGLHVHLDARNKSRHIMFNNLVRCQPLLFALVPKSRRNNHFCAKSPSPKFDYYAESDERYWAVNPKSYRRHKTIEVRLHSGTLNAFKISRWIELLKAIAYGPYINEFNSIDDLHKLRLNDSLVKYILNRIEKLKGETEFKSETAPDRPLGVTAGEGIIINRAAELGMHYLFETTQPPSYEYLYNIAMGQQRAVNGNEE